MKKLLCIFGLIGLLAACGGTASAAYDPTQQACSVTGASQSSACSPGAEITGNNGVLRKVSTVIATVAGIAAVIVVVIGGFQYVVSNGDPQKAASARSAIIGGAVGLVIIASAQGILLFVLSRIQ